MFIDILIHIVFSLVQVYIFFSRPSPKAGRELQTALDRMIEWTLSEPEPVTGPWVYTEYLFSLSSIVLLFRLYDPSITILTPFLGGALTNYLENKGLVYRPFSMGPILDTAKT